MEQDKDQEMQIFNGNRNLTYECWSKSEWQLKCCMQKQMQMWILDANANVNHEWWCKKWMQIEIMHAKTIANLNRKWECKYELWMAKQKQKLIQTFDGNGNSNHEC